MVASKLSIPLPNIRAFFVPDSGYAIADVDLAGADAQVVAWEAEDEDLKAAFRSGIKIHKHNALAMFDTDKEPIYTECKSGVHATNYGASYRTLARKLGWKESKAKDFQDRWFKLHPGILEWQRKTEEQLSRTRTVWNKFGYRIVFFDRIEGLLPEALAWIPQSTVALNTILGALALRAKVPWAELLLQVHDSLIFQFPRERDSELWQVRNALTIPVPYNDPLIIPWELKTSIKSWGHCQKRPWPKEHPVCAIYQKER